MSKTFSPTPNELALVNQIFARVDTQKTGILTGDVAVEVFQGSRLPPQTLGEIWQLADSDNQGFLTRKGVAIALRLIGHAQKGEQITDAYTSKPGPLAEIEGYVVPVQAPARAMSPHMTGPPPLTPADKAKFARIFASCGPVSGLLSGEKARDVFLKSKLPMDKLGAIWNLADTKGRGALDLADFTVGMYLIQSTMSGQLPFVPTSLPPGLYEQAGGQTAVATHGTGSSGFPSPGLSGGFPGRAPVTQQFTGAGMSPMQPQFTGSKPAPALPSRAVPAAAALGASAFGVQPQFTGQPIQVPWDINPAEKANADRFFDGLDTVRQGFIEGEAAVGFLTQSGLPGDVLASIWDLSDIDDDGRLTKDEFAVAMHLIQMKMSGKDLPQVLPVGLVPPSFRAAAPGIQSRVAPAQSHIEPLKDLLWDDAPAMTTQAPLQPQATGNRTPRPPPPPVPGRTPAPAPPPPMPVAAPYQDPFGSSAGPFGNAASLDKDLLGDSDDDAGPEAAAPSPPTTVRSPPPVVEDKSAEIGNAKNQLSSTTRALDTVQAERSEADQRLAGQAAELSALQTQLSTAKAAYETETRLLATLRERYAAQQTDIAKVRQELITAESDLSAAREDRAEIEGAVLRDKEEIRGLQKKMKDVGTEVEMLKLEGEKARKEAKQQKGLLAIAKKQLVTREAERAKTEQERNEAHAEAAELTSQRESIETELAKEHIPAPAVSPPLASVSPPITSPDISVVNGNLEAINAAAHPLPLSPEVTGVSQPAGFISPMHTGASNNPFARLAGTPRSQSPFLPFANSTSPAPTPAQPNSGVAETSELDDPFGLSSSEPAAPTGDHAVAKPKEDLFSPATPLADTEKEHKQPDVQPATPRQAPATLASATLASPAELDTPSSPTNTDFFSTPPSTAVPSMHSPDTHHQSPAEAAAHAASRHTVPGGFPNDDLFGAVQEKEIDESDSSDEDDVPLATIAEKGKGKETESAKVQEAANGSASSTFDDAFGEKVTTPKAEPAPLHGDPDTSAFDDAFADPPTQAAPAPVNGASAFDEAMGALPSKPANGSAASFSFDNAFEDSFDFGSSGAATTPQPVPAGPTPFVPMDGFGGAFAPTSAASAPAAGAPPLPERTFSFDDAFGTNDAAAPANTADHPNGNDISFDDAFGVTPASPINNPDTTSSKASAVSQFQAPPGAPPGSLPNSPMRGSSVASFPTRSASPPSRGASPPPRHHSPRPRASTASSKDGSHDKHDLPAKPEKTSKSRLSIRLPFGKKKNKAEAAPPLPGASASSSHLSPPREDSEGEARGGTRTPAAEDDIDSVKQLCGMGFSRAQAVEALEKTDYDVQRALNSLLGQA